MCVLCLLRLIGWPEMSYSSSLLARLAFRERAGERKITSECFAIAAVIIIFVAF